jgi:hypothetical protein
VYIIPRTLSVRLITWRQSRQSYAVDSVKKRGFPPQADNGCLQREQRTAKWTFANDGQPAMRSRRGSARLPTCLLSCLSLLQLICSDLGTLTGLRPTKLRLVRCGKQQKRSTSTGTSRVGTERVDCTSASEGSPSTPSSWWIAGVRAWILMFRCLFHFFQDVALL